MPGKILIVDDEADLIAPLEMYLQSNGYKIITASDGVEALQLAEEESPDLILLDIIMPRMDGYATLEKLRADEKTKSIPVIMLTVKTEKEIGPPMLVMHWDSQYSIHWH